MTDQTRSGRLRVLSVLLDFPFPATTGLHLRMVANLEALNDLGYESHVLWFSTGDRCYGLVDDKPLAAISAGHLHAAPRVEQESISAAARAASKVSFAVSPVLEVRDRTRGPFRYPYSMRYDAVGAAGLVAAEVARLSPDVVVLPSQGMHWMAALPPGVRVVIDAADLLTDVTRRLAQTDGGGPMSRLGLWANHLACAAQERRYLARADEVWVTTRAEANRAIEIAPGCVPVVVPNSVVAAPGNTTSVQPSKVANRSFGMLATWSYRPNADAARRLVEGVLPRLAGTDLKLVLAGAGLPDDLRRLGGARFEYLGPVEHQSEFYEKVDVVALPIDLRGGVPLKLAEALGRGVPVVASPELVEGLDLTAGVDVVIAADDETLADQIASLIDDGPRRLALAAAGLQAHERQFSPASVRAAIAGSAVFRALEGAAPEARAR